MKTLFLCSLVVILCSGCYRFPDEDHLSTVPMTNNPNVIPQRQAMAMPGMN